MAAGNRHSEPSSDASRDQTGIAKAKTAGIYKGRPASIDAAHVRAMKAQGKGASEIAKALKIGRASVYRVLEAG
jgi:DNA invertase Pin-like site-specific DNA recombinase